LLIVHVLVKNLPERLGFGAIDEPPSRNFANWLFCELHSRHRFLSRLSLEKIPNADLFHCTLKPSSDFEEKRRLPRFNFYQASCMEVYISRRKKLSFSSISLKLKQC